MSELPIEERLRNAVQANRNAMPTFSNVYSNDLIEEAADTIAQQEKDIAELRDAEKKAFWAAFEGARMTSRNFSIETAWDQYQEGLRLNKHTEPSAAEVKV